MFLMKVNQQRKNTVPEAGEDGGGGLHPPGSGENGTHGVMRFPRLDLSQSPLPRAPSPAWRVCLARPAPMSYPSRCGSP